MIAHSPNPSRQTERAPNAAEATAQSNLKALRNAFAGTQWVHSQGGVMETGWGIDGFIVPRTDTHLGESVIAREERLLHVSAFSGSAGEALVTGDGAALFVDGRYSLQARQQASASWDVLGDTRAHRQDWVGQHLSRHQRIGCDLTLMSESKRQQWSDILAAVGVQLVGVQVNPVDLTWHQRPPRRPNQVYQREARLAGQSVADKLRSVIAEIGALGGDSLVLVGLDDIAWLCNWRGSDLPHSPVAQAYALVRSAAPSLVWASLEAMAPQLREELSRAGVELREIEIFFSQFPSEQKGKVIVDAATTPAWFMAPSVHTDAEIIRADNPVRALKARKNPAEIAGMRAAHLRDGVAMVRFLMWLEGELAQISDTNTLSEWQVARKIDQARSHMPGWLSPSFDTICGFGGNAAIVHYRATQNDSALIGNDSLLLVDSGGQYTDGTTDITRTIAIGTPTARQRADCTAVLQAHIALASLQFPVGTSGARLDAIARAPLWRKAADYAHGTGHGVGAALHVHEGGVSISARTTQPLQPGHIVSIEPGLYVTGSHGVRWENLALVVPAVSDGFLALENLSWCPFDKRTLQCSKLSPEELCWLNNYHNQVYHTLSPHLEESEAQWLEQMTKVID